MKTKLQLMLSIAFLIFVMTSHGQKLKNKAVQVKHVRLPLEKLPVEFTTYSVKVYGSAASGRSAQLANDFHMAAFKRIGTLAGNQGHLRVSVNSGYVNSGKVERQTETKTTKNKEGVETNTKYYWYIQSVSMHPSFKIIDPEGNVLAKGGGQKNSTITSKKYTSLSSAIKNYSHELGNARRKFANDEVGYVCMSAQNKLSETFDFEHRQTFEQLYFINKHETETGFRTAFEFAKAELENKDNICLGGEEMKAKLEAPISFWSRQAAKKPGSDKKLKKIYKAANYNLALVSFYLNNFETAKKHAQNVISSEGKDNKCQNILENILKVQDQLKFHELSSTRYCRDISNALAPGQVSALEEEKEEIKKESNTTAGTVTYDGKILEGAFAQHKDADNLTFGEDGNTKFIMEKEGALVNYQMSNEKISAFSIDERNFIKTNFIPSAKGKNEEKTCILEVLYNSDRIQLYEYFPVAGKLADNSSEFAFKKANDEKIVSLQATQFLLWDKGLGKFFADCQDLNNMCLAGGIKATKEDLVKASRIYAEVCE